MLSDIEWIPLLSFILITTLSPGPNNLSCASMGVLHGYKRSFKFIMGIVVGLFTVMAVSGLISNLMLTIFPVPFSSFDLCILRRYPRMSMSSGSTAGDRGGRPSSGGMGQ